MPNCDYFEELIARSADEELSAEETAALHAHLSKCESCRTFYETLTLATDALRGQVEPPEELFSGIMTEIRRISPKKRKRAQIISIKSLSLAAVAAIAIFAGVRLMPGKAESAAPVSRMMTAGGTGGAGGKGGGGEDGGRGENGGSGGGLELIEAPAAEEESFPLTGEEACEEAVNGADFFDSAMNDTANAPALTVPPEWEEYLREEVLVGTEESAVPGRECDERRLLSDGTEYRLWYEGEKLLWQCAGEDTAFISLMKTSEYRLKSAEIG